MRSWRTKDFPWKLREILPKVLRAGEMAGTLTKEGARLLDRSGVCSRGFPVSAGGRRRNRNDRDKERGKSAPAMCPQGRACLR